MCALPQPTLQFADILPLKPAGHEYAGHAICLVRAELHAWRGKHVDWRMPWAPPPTLIAADHEAHVYTGGTQACLLHDHACLHVHWGSPGMPT